MLRAVHNLKVSNVSLGSTILLIYISGNTLIRMGMVMHLCHPSSKAGGPELEELELFDRTFLINDQNSNSNLEKYMHACVRVTSLNELRFPESFQIHQPFRDCIHLTPT